MNKTIFEAAVKSAGIALTFKNPADQTLSRFFRENRNFGPRERQQIAEIVYSVIRHKRFLECSLDQTDARLICLLALNKIMGFSQSVLSNVATNREMKTLEANLSAKPTDLTPAEKFSLPDWLWDRLTNTFGSDRSAQLAQSLLRKANFDVRVNTVKSERKKILEALNEADISASPTQFSPIGIHIKNNIGLEKQPLFLDGMFEVQDEGSQILCQLVDARRGQMVVDFCAGAGGKTLALGASMSNQGRIYAMDVSAARLERMKPRLKRSGLSNVFPQVIGSENDPRLKRLFGKMDRVLIDAPCTGFGTLRRNPDLKWRKNVDDIAELSTKQLNILNAASRLAKVGGRVIYATCSILEEENEAVIDAFLSQNPEKFKVLDARQILAKRGIDLPHSSPYLKLFPDEHQCDGFFGAVLERAS